MNSQRYAEARVQRLEQLALRAGLTEDEIRVLPAVTERAAAKVGISECELIDNALRIPEVRSYLTEVCEKVAREMQEVMA